MTTWQLQDARNRFSAVVDAALAGEPQQVTRGGKPVVVVLAVAEYDRLCRNQPDHPDRTPNFVDHLLAIPKAPDNDAFELPSRTRDYRLRDIAL